MTSLLEKQRQSNSDDILSSLVFNAQNDAKRIYKAKTDILPFYKFKKWYKPSKKLLQSVYNSVVHTNGTDELAEEESLIKTAPDMIPVRWTGVDKKSLEYGETIMIDIDSESTNLPVFCKILIIHQGAVHVRSPALLSRDVSVQVGNNFMLNNLKQSEDSSTHNKQKRASWSLTDEYYSAPFYQYRGKSSGVKYHQDTQVTATEFLSYATHETDTDDSISHLRLHIHSKSDIMSRFSLQPAKLSTTDQAEEINYSPSVEKRFRQTNIDTNKLNLKFNCNNIKRYDNVCSLTGTRRLTLIMPPTSNMVELDNNIIKELDYLKQPAKYEEYSVIDTICDTSDLSKHIQFDNFTYVQLLSENAYIGKGIQKLSISDIKSHKHDSPNLTGNKTNTQNTTTAALKPNEKQLKTTTVSRQIMIEKPHRTTHKSTISTQTDLFKKISDSISPKKEQATTTTSDYNYDISDILERYNLKQLATASLLSSQEMDKKLTTPRTPRTPRNSIVKLKDSPKNEQKRDDLSLDLTQIVSSARDNQSNTNRSNRSSSSHHYYKDLDYGSNDYYYYYYYNNNNSRYPLISKAVGNSHRGHEVAANEILVNMRSKSSKPILMRGHSLRIANSKEDSQSNSDDEKSVIRSSRKSSSSNQSSQNEQKESSEKNTEIKSSQVKHHCCNCNKKKRTSRQDGKPVKREEILLKIDKSKVHSNIDNPNIDKIILIPAVLTTRNDHHHHHHSHHQNHHDQKNQDPAVRYRRSKYDRSLYMYSDQQQNRTYHSSSSNESDDTTIINLTRRFKNNYEDATNEQVGDEQQDRNQNQLIDQLII